MRLAGSCSWSPTRSPARSASTPASIQVVTPVHRGPAGTLALNAALKARLNPGRARPGGPASTSATASSPPRTISTPSRPGTPTARSASSSAPRAPAVTVEFASGLAEVRGRALADLAHGWAITVHRAQGSEFPAVVVVLPGRGGRHALAAAGLHRADPGAAAPVDRARGRPAAGPRGAPGRRPAAPDLARAGAGGALGSPAAGASAGPTLEIRAEQGLN